jgi:drug/metabolite transporter (DMT)-like permease
MGIAFAFAALALWGVGDFLIQRSARRFGDWIALFFIEGFATVVLLPFVWHEIPVLIASPNELALLFGTSVVLLVAAVIDFESLRVGKLAVVEPVYALEVPIAAVLGGIFAGEFLSGIQLTLTVALVASIMLLATRSLRDWKHAHAERGVWLAIFAAGAMGASNLLFGLGGRAVGPLMVNWFVSALVFIVCVVYLTATGRWYDVRRDWTGNKKLIVGVSVIDKAAWLAYTASTLFVPIAIATALSEAYIALAALLGILVNRERLMIHQRIGLVGAVIAAICLAVVTDS